MSLCVQWQCRRGSPSTPSCSSPLGRRLPLPFPHATALPGPRRLGRFFSAGPVCLPRGGSPAAGSPGRDSWPLSSCHARFLWLRAPSRTPRPYALGGACARPPSSLPARPPASWLFNGMSEGSSLYLTAGSLWSSPFPLGLSRPEVAPQPWAATPCRCRRVLCRPRRALPLPALHDAASALPAHVSMVLHCRVLPAVVSRHGMIRHRSRIGTFLVVLHRHS